MDQLGYLVVVVIIVVASVIGKIQEQRRAQERKKSQKPVRPEDLPEATRRLLFGTPEKHASETRRGEPQVRTAQPRTASPVQRQEPQTVRRPVQPQAQRQPQQAVPPPPPPRRQRPAARREAKPQTQSLQAQHTQIMAQRRKHLQEAQAQHAASLKKTQQMQRSMTGRSKQKARAARPAAHRVSGLFANLDDVRRGIVMMEVLGSPKAFEWLPGWYPNRGVTWSHIV